MIVATLPGAFNVRTNRFASLTFERKIASSKSNTTGGRRRIASRRSTRAGPIGNISR
jgi:hypothetical protein